MMGADAIRCIRQIDNSGTGWHTDLTQAVYEGSISGGDSVPRGVAFSLDGMQMFTVGSSSDWLRQYTLNSAYDVTQGASYVGYISALEALPESVSVSADGGRLFSLRSGLREWNMSTPNLITSAAYVANHSLPTSAGHGLSFSADGLNLYVISTSAFWCTLSVPFDMTTMVYTGSSYYMGGQDGDPNGIAISADGRKAYMIGALTNRVFEYELAIAWNISSAFYTGISFNAGGYDSSMKDIAFNHDGSKMYLVGSSGDKIYQFSVG